MADQLFNFADGSGTKSGGNQYFNALPSMASTNNMTVKAGGDNAPVMFPPGQTGGGATPITTPRHETSGTTPGASGGYGGSGGGGGSFADKLKGFDWTGAGGAIGGFLDMLMGGGKNPQGDLANNFASWLNGQVGKGATPYPGELSAPKNQMLLDLIKSYTDPNGVMAQMLKTGMPIDQMPQWKAAVEAAQRQIGQGATNLKESFNFAGGLAGSPFGAASADYQSQTAKDLNAQLLNAQAGALENARGRQMGAAQQEAGFGGMIQGFDQAEFDRKYQEFIRTQPEYSPLLNMMYGLTTDAKQTAGGGAQWGDSIGQLAKIAMMFL